ncbi:butyrate kinase [Limnochorda pilosa]|uniref:Probable butyrate kinase n=1 Tax=Limnochorda pilosa TaxID=1555112 RepID=A0A0K2SPT9_LIMPI|nr:butyrate kinase [Limnochorda pilosa]BAS29135.1 butyrate kinase [Limnochorda pilosa]
MAFRILVINPGSCTTRLALFEDLVCRQQVTLEHPTFLPPDEDLERRIGSIEAWLSEVDQPVDAIAARGGMLHPLPGGTYRVNDAMCEDLRTSRYGWHPSNLAALIARRLGEQREVPQFVVDPVVVDELEDVARISGLPSLPRRSVFHALNQKAVARRVAASLGMRYEEAHMVVAHMGGGITVGVHAGGRVIDVNNGLDGEGPMSPNRAGTLPAGQLVDLCFSGRYTRDQVCRMLVGQGGLVAHLGTSDAREIEERIRRGDEEARPVYEAMAYQVAKAIAAGFAVLKGRIDACILTGGLAHSEFLVGRIRDRIDWACRVVVSPGEDEMLALASGVLRVLRGQEEARTYLATEPSEGRDEIRGTGDHRPGTVQGV